MFELIERNLLRNRDVFNVLLLLTSPQRAFWKVLRIILKQSIDSYSEIDAEGLTYNQFKLSDSYYIVFVKFWFEIEEGLI